MTRVFPSSPRGWVAAIASLILPGLGQLIGGRFVRAAALLSLQIVVDAIAVATFLLIPLGATGFALALLIVVAWRVWVSRDAYRINRDATTRRAHGAPAWVAAAGLFAIATYAIGQATETMRWRMAGRSYRLPADSMAPALVAGDYLLTIPLDDRPIQRGEIVVFQWPEDTTKTFIKRVAGLPGDTIRMRDGLLEVNGKREREDYVIREDTSSDHTGDEFAWQQAYAVPATRVAASPSPPSRDNWGPLVVPAGSFFMLGDNRDNSLDSRYWGFVRADQLFARPWRIYFSRDPESGSVRWGRIGRFLQGS